MGYDDTKSNIIIDTHDEIKKIIFHVFKASIDQGNCPDLLKIAKAILIFKYDDQITLAIIKQYQYFQLSRKFLNEKYAIEYTIIFFLII